jgi:lipopolysaccharide/colanic/teichoic acid biosynthesis glycosyltransferase
MDQPRNAWTERRAPLGVRLVKRAFDLAASGAGLALFLPLFLLVAAAIKCDSRGPVFFRQIRVGRDGKLFRILKFRTMRIESEGAGPNFTADGDRRVTRIGEFLRVAKFDELPQLINVLLGDMSLVGPRPETPDLMLHYTPAQRTAFLSVRPGITDYASILLRNEGALLARSSDPARFYREVLMPVKHELCRIYLCEMGLRADLKIIFLTLNALVSRQPPIEPFTTAPDPSLDERLGLLRK